VTDDGGSKYVALPFSKYFVPASPRSGSLIPPSSFRTPQGGDPESITTVASMDSGFAPSGAPRNDGLFGILLTNSSVAQAPKFEHGIHRRPVPACGFPSTTSREI